MSPLNRDDDRELDQSEINPSDGRMELNGPQKSQRKNENSIKNREGRKAMREIIVKIILAATVVITLAITLIAFIWCINDVEQQVEQQEAAVSTNDVYVIEGLDYNQMYENCGVVCASNVMDIVKDLDTTEEEVMSYAVTHGLATKAGGTTAMDIQNIMYEMAGIESSWVNNPTLDELEVAAEEGVAIIAVHAETVYYGGKGELDHWITVIDKLEEGGWVVADSNGVAYYSDEQMAMATDGQGQEMIVVR